MKLGDCLPAITLAATGQQTVLLSAQVGHPLVLYFYPRDDTPGCRQEGEDFRDHFSKFQKQQAVILGVSQDNLADHERFKARYQFPFDLLSDPEGNLCNVFDVIKPKMVFGKPVIGIQRSTFLFDSQGLLYREWRNVKVPDHVLEVLAAVQSLT